MCLECWSKKETKMKIDGTWDEYQREQDELYRFLCKRFERIRGIY